MIAYADDYEEVNEVGVGNIAAVTGLKVIFTNISILLSWPSLFYI